MSESEVALLENREAGGVGPPRVSRACGSLSCVVREWSAVCSSVAICAMATVEVNFRVP